ncbi:MAG: hypothetical protein BroJett014_31990 [Planctomycetota bacterium]|nr:MAG: hypothetical protein BroJett014_31990 [Planctomycetota bacterium]
MKGWIGRRTGIRRIPFKPCCLQVYLSCFDFGQIKVPTLFVHHRDDGCVVCPYTRARDISSKYGFPLITVTGATNPTGDPCQAYSHHGFRGREKETMAAILKWVKSRDVTETIN